MRLNAFYKVVLFAFPFVGFICMQSFRVFRLFQKWPTFEIENQQWLSNPNQNDVVLQKMAMPIVKNIFIVKKYFPNTTPFFKKNEYAINFQQLKLDN
jgi:hypothetical protein